MARRSKENAIDWEAVERDFRIGALTNKELAAKHGVADSNIRARAKKYGWTKDLTETVRVATKAAVIADAQARASEIGAEIGAKQAGETVGAVEAQVGENLRAIKSHLAWADRMKRLAHKAMDEIEATLAARHLIAAEVEALSADSPMRAGFVEKMLGTKGVVEALDKTGALMTKVVSVERESLGLNEDSKGDGGTWEDLLLEAHKRMAR